jgi:hypothetical protein
VAAIVDHQLLEMTRFAASELRNDREPAAGTSAPRQSVDIELF